MQVPCNRPSMNETPTASFCQAMSKRRPCLPRLSIQPPESYSTSTCSTNSFIEPRIPAGHGECQSVPTRRVKDEPVSILPHLYLGSAFHSGCDNTLQKLGITAVLNVSKRCPNHFPQSLTYKNIPVDDDTDADLSEWFHEAASFIGEFYSIVELWLPLKFTILGPWHVFRPAIKGKGKCKLDWILIWVMCVVSFSSIGLSSVCWCKLNLWGTSRLSLLFWEEFCS